jgi:hypothetical protein
MLEFETVDGILWAFAILATVWAFAPPVFTWFGWLRIHCTVAADPRAVEPAGDDPDYAEKYRQLLALGFRPTGLLTEHCRLFAVHWYKPFVLRCLATAEGTCHASLYRLAGEPVRVKLDTFTSGGLLVRTAMPGVGWEDRDEGWVRFEVPPMSMLGLYSRHQEHVVQVLAETGRSAVPATLWDCAHVDEALERARLRRTGGPPAFLLLPMLFFLGPALLALLTGWWLLGAGALPQTAPVAVFFGAGVYYLFVNVLLPAAIRGASAEPNNGSGLTVGP